LSAASTRFFDSYQKIIEFFIDIASILEKVIDLKIGDEIFGNIAINMVDVDKYNRFTTLGYDL
jgi:hypothetical protein